MQMEQLASTLPEYNAVMSMPGVGKSLGPQLMAEIGDIRRFAHKGALIAYMEDITEKDEEDKNVE